MPKEDAHIEHLNQVIAHLKGMTACVVRGYEQAMEELGREGDQRNEDWSKPYQFLKGRLREIKRAQ